MRKGGLAQRRQGAKIRIVSHRAHRGHREGSATFMIIEGFIWLTDIMDKLENKHGVAMSEVESILLKFRFSTG